jgi:tetratricopeptide (TPR) repeat protein
MRSFLLLGLVAFAVAWSFPATAADAIPAPAKAAFDRSADKAEKGDLRGAISDYGRAIQLDPSDGAAFANRGLMRAAAGDKNGAASDFKAAIAVFEERGNARLAETARRQLEKL